MSITEEHAKEGLAEAHIAAIAAMAGATVSISKRDYGVDGRFNAVERLEGGGFAESGIAIDFQAKSTVIFEIEDGCVVYDLEVRAYNNMVGRAHHRTTLMLILLCLPREQAQWYSLTPDGTLLKDRCYWHILPPGPKTANVRTTRIRIPIDQRLSPDDLGALLQLEQLRSPQCAS
jgi:hypothetical protein